MVDVACVANTADVLGETPLWHPAEGKLYWFDLFKPAIHRFDPRTGQVESWTPPEKLGSAALCADGRLLLAARGGLGLFDLSSGRFERVADPESGGTENLLNDGRCDRRGRFWVGSMNKMITRPSGRLYRFARGQVDVADEGFWVSNGICFSPDDKRMYFADSHLRTIFAYTFDLEAGTVGPRSEFAAMPGPGVPDGATVDTEGFLWSASFDGGCLMRFAPNGRLDRTVKLPVTRPSACAFGGPDLATLYVTTARFRLPADKLAAEPDAGGLLALDVGAKGLPEPLFAG